MRCIIYFNVVVILKMKPINNQSYGFRNTKRNNFKLKNNCISSELYGDQNFEVWNKTPLKTFEREF